MRLGPTDLLVEAADPVALAAAARALPGVLDAVPGDGTVLVRGVGSLPEGLAAAPVRGREHLLDVVYDGPELDTFGLPAAEVVARHTAAVYRVAYLGFAPGFGYLDGLDPALHRPRLDAPRPRVPAFSVGVAAGRSCVYPTASPGGWRLLGRAVGTTLFDPAAGSPALLEPGDTVRFRAVDAGGPPVAPTAARRPHPGPFWQVETPGAQTLVVDAGRPGYAHLGVPRSGALDPAALARANALVGNPDATAGLECVLTGPLLRGPRQRWAAVVWPGGEYLQRADRLDLTGLPAHRVWVAVEGGLDVAPVLGSRSADLLGRLGPPPLAAGDSLPLGALAGRTGEAPKPGAVTATLRVRPGPDADLADRLPGSWTVEADSDRSGIRLSPNGKARPHDHAGRTVGLVAGAVQLPPGGHPVLFAAGHPATGGYPIAGVVDASDLAAVAQLKPGDRVEIRS